MPSSPSRFSPSSIALRFTDLSERWLPDAFIFALMAFGHLFGFVGVLIALPASAVLLVAIRRARAGYLASDLYLPGAATAPAAPAQPKDGAE